jgi:hypothetical protein
MKKTESNAISIQKILTEGFVTAKAAYLKIFPIFLVAFGINQLFFVMGTSVSDASFKINFMNVAVVIIASLITMFGSILSLILIASTYQKKTFSFLESCRVAFHVFPKAFLASLISGIIIGIGLIFFVVPGFIAATFLAIYLPIFIFESTSIFDAMKISFERTKNHFTLTASIISLKFLVMLGAPSLIKWLISFFFGNMGGAIDAFDGFAQAIFSALFYPFILGVSISLYFNLSQK